MKHCEHCGEEIKGSYLQINCEFFDEYMIEFDHGDKTVAVRRSIFHGTTFKILF